MLLSLLWDQRAEFRWNKQGVQHHPNPRELNSCSRESWGCPVQQFQRHCVYFRSARVYSRSARLPGLTELGSERCFEVAPAVYTALWERCPGHLSWPQLSWSTGQHSLAQRALSPMAHRCLAHLVSLHSPPHTISVCFCPPVPSPQLSSFSSEHLANKQTNKKKNPSSSWFQPSQTGGSCTRLIIVPIPSQHSQCPLQKTRMETHSRIKKGQQRLLRSDRRLLVMAHSILDLQPSQLKALHPPGDAENSENSHPLSNTPDLTPINTKSGKISEPTQAPHFLWLLKR